jgi:Family of unknown function (DUF6527)
MKQDAVRAEFVEFIPRNLDPGVFYISRRFRTGSHLCCCGCSTKIVTPFRPTEYTLTETGKSITIRPSIGNWNFPCRSHYLITGSRVVWVGAMSQEEIDFGRKRDEQDKDRYFRRQPEPTLYRRIRLWVREILFRIKC